MRAYAWKALRQYIEAGHADAAAPLKEWFTSAEKADWASFADVRRGFGAVDLVGDRPVSNIGGNKYRLVCLVRFDKRALYVLWIGNHAEYDRIDVKSL